MDKQECVIHRSWPLAVLHRPIWLPMIVLGALIAPRNLTVGLFLLLLGIVVLVLSYLDAKDDHLVISSEGVRRVQRTSYVFGWNESVINSRHIQSVTLQQSVLEKLFDVGTLIIETAGTQPFEFPDAMKARWAVEVIRSLAFGGSQAGDQIARTNKSWQAR